MFIDRVLKLLPVHFDHYHHHHLGIAFCLSLNKHNRYFHNYCYNQSKLFVQSVQETKREDSKMQF